MQIERNQCYSYCRWRVGVACGIFSVSSPPQRRLAAERIDFEPRAKKWSLQPGGRPQEEDYLSSGASLSLARPRAICFHFFCSAAHRNEMGARRQESIIGRAKSISDTHSPVSGSLCPAAAPSWRKVDSRGDTRSRRNTHPLNLPFSFVRVWAENGGAGNETKFHSRSLHKSAW